MRTAVVGIILLAATAILPVAAAEIGDLLDKAIAGSHRDPAKSARDEYRHPKQTLEFFGLAPSMTVIEMRPGGSGWYTEILAPVLRDDGKLIVAVAGEDNSADYRARGHRKLMARFAADPDTYGKVEHVVFQPPAKMQLGPSGSVDMVVTFRQTHNWIRAEAPRNAFQAMFDVLKPGGVLGVVQHRAPADWDAEDGAKKGYVPEQYIIDLAASVGFELAGKSETNANPKDDKSWEKGVWTLPPVLRQGDVDREKYIAIGESDRMTLKFVKRAD
jgi:predicted methyltransferase